MSSRRAVRFKTSSVRRNDISTNRSESISELCCDQPLAGKPTDPVRGMPSSASLQIVARGRQDAFLTGDPQTTFFKHVYRRHTPFAIESIPIEFDGTPEFGRRISCLVPKKAELLWQMFLEIDLPAIPADTSDPENPIPRYWVNDIGHALIEDVSIEIGEKEIDKHTGEWLQIWSELTTPADKRDGFNEMIGHWNVYPPADDAAAGPLKLVIPFRFWFNRTIGAALPLIALQAHPVRIIIHLRRFQDLWWSTELKNPATLCPHPDPVSPARVQLFGDYVFLDKPERHRFAAAEHEYLIEQLQIAPRQSIAKGLTHFNVSLTFNHAVKEFVWVLQQDRVRKAHEWFNFSDRMISDGGDPLYPGDPCDLLDTAMLLLDGYDRFYRRGARYFRITQPWQYHTAIPNSFIYLYSFCLKPEEEHPTGSLNCSMIDDVMLNLRFDPLVATCGTVNYLEDRHIQVYATNYNVFRVVGGLGGLAFLT